jgi:hypothetical protein
VRNLDADSGEDLVRAKRLAEVMRTENRHRKRVLSTEC